MPDVSPVPGIEMIGALLGKVRGPGRLVLAKGTLAGTAVAKMFFPGSALLMPLATVPSGPGRTLPATPVTVFTIPPSTPNSPGSP